MNNKLVVGAAVVSAIVVGALIKASLADAVLPGYSSCTTTAMICPMHIDATSKDFIATTSIGKTIDPNLSYGTIVIPAQQCTDMLNKAGALVVTLGDKNQSLGEAQKTMGVFDSSLCKTVDCNQFPGLCTSTDITTKIQLIPEQCAWRPKGVKANQCTRIDGGNPGDENTMQPGGWAGVGCLRKNCVEIAGVK